MAGELPIAPLAANADLIRGIIQDVQALFRQEINLATAEVKRDARTLGMVGVQLLAAGLLGLLTLGLVAVMLVHLLTWLFPELPVWGSYGIVALGFGAISAFAMTSGLKELKSANLGPTQTIETMKENGQWLKAQL